MPLKLAKGVGHAGSPESELAAPFKKSAKNIKYTPDIQSGTITDVVDETLDGTASDSTSMDNIMDNISPGDKGNGSLGKTERGQGNAKAVLKKRLNSAAPGKVVGKKKVVKKGIAQVVKKEKKKGGWKYVDE